MIASTLPKIVDAGRGENWTDYGHHPGAWAFIWCGPRRGLVIKPGDWGHGEIVEEGFVPRSISSAIIGRVDGPMATMYFVDPDLERRVPDFVMALTEKFPEVKTIRRFRD